MAAAKKNEKKEETAQDSAPAGAPAASQPANQDATTPATLAPSRVEAQIGDRVFFHREVNTGNGVKLVPSLAFLVKEAAPESNLPKNAFDLAVLTNVYEVRHGVMFSESPKGGYWSYIRA